MAALQLYMEVMYALDKYALLFVKKGVVIFDAKRVVIVALDISAVLLYKVVVYSVCMVACSMYALELLNE
jgi:uncharacterized membrane protein